MKKEIIQCVNIHKYWNIWWKLIVTVLSLYCTTGFIILWSYGSIRFTTLVCLFGVQIGSSESYIWHKERKKEFFYQMKIEMNEWMNVQFTYYYSLFFSMENSWDQTYKHYYHHYCLFVFLFFVVFLVGR